MAASAQKNAYPDPRVLADGVAVVTGGASGIGLALAEKAIEHGLHPVLADIEAAAIASAEERLAGPAEAAGVEVFGHRTDVSSEASVQALGAAVAERFPGKPVTLLCCNAGVGGGGPVLSAKDVDWDFVLGVNVKGVANCVREFVPKMVAGDAAGSRGGHVVPGWAVRGARRLRRFQARLRGARRGAVPGTARAALGACAVSERRRHRHRHVRAQPSAALRRAARPWTRQPHRRALQGVRHAAFARCAEAVFDAIQSGVFYVMAEAEEDPGFVRLEAETRMKGILEGGLPFRPRSEWISKVFDVNTPLPDES